LILNQFLSLAEFQCSEKNLQLSNDPIMLLEHSFSDFGDADAVLLIDSGNSRQSIFFEAKVKTSLGKLWSISKEFERFEKGMSSKVSSSNLFMQLYLKQALMEGLQKMEIRRLQSEGIPFPAWSSKRCRKLGKNEVVKRGAELLKSGSSSSHYVAIVPDEARIVRQFIKRDLGKLRAPRLEYCNTDHWGFMTWKSIRDFCQNSGLEQTERAFKHNEGQIY